MNIFSLLTHKLQWLAKRHSVLTGNLVHGSIPGYEAKDLKETFFGKKIQEGMVQTHASHLSVSPNSKAASPELFKVQEEKNLSGNTVNPEKEMMKINETGTKHYELAEAYSHYDKLFKISLGKGGR